MRVFVTGGSGFLGGHAIEHFVRAGHEVRAMARSEKSAEGVRALGATPVRCDLGDVSAEHVRGCDAVVHCAARAEEWGTRAQFWDANVVGTEKMLDAARAGGARRFVNVGTEASVFAGSDLVELDESTPYPTRQRYLYSETKAEAEKRVLAANVDGTFETISIRPRLVWGPRDQSVLPAVLRMAREGKFAWLDGGKRETSATNVKNVVHALELALTRGKPGHAYYVADAERHTMREFLGALAEAAAGVDLGTKSVASWVARPAAKVIEGTWRLFGMKSTPPMTRFAIDMMSSTVTIKTDAARADLGYAPIVTYQQGLEELRAARGEKR